MRKATLLVGSTLVLALALAAGAARADVKVGVTSAVNPQAIGQPPTEPERMLLVGGDNFADEKISTGPEGQAQFLFLDGSSLSVGPNAELKIDQYVYDSNTKTGKFAISAAQGVFKLVGGAISKTNEILITTPVATAGIRGGIANIESRPNQPMVAQFLFGERLRVTANGITQEATRPGFQIIVPPGGAPQPPVRMNTAEVRAVLANFQGRSRTSNNQGPSGQGGPGGAQGSTQEPAQDQALANSGVSSSSGSSQAPESLSTYGTTTGYTGTFNPNANTLLNNIITDAQTINQSTTLINETLFGHFFCCNLFTFFNTSNASATPNPNNNFTFTANLTSTNLNFSLPVNGSNQNFSFPYIPGGTTSFSNLALINGDTIAGNVVVSADRQFFYIFGNDTPGSGSNCGGGGGGGGGGGNCRFALFAGVPTAQNAFPTSGVSTYNLNPLFDNIPFVANASNNNPLLSNVGGAGTAISPLFVRWSPVTNPTLAQGSDQRAVLMQASLVISGTGANQQAGLFGITGSFFQEQNSTIAMGAGLVGLAQSCATCPSVRVGSGVASAQISTPSGLGNAIFGPNANYIVAVPDILSGVPGGASTRSTGAQIQIPFNTPASAQANNANFFATVATQNAGTSAATQAVANASLTTQTLVGYTGGGIVTNNGSSPSGFGGSGPNVTITTDASSQRVSASFTVTDVQNGTNYGLQFGSTSGFNDGRSAFISDQVFAARDAVTTSGGPVSTINGSTANFSRLFMVSSTAVPIDFQSFAGPGVTACTCSFMQWGWWIGEVDPSSAQNRFLGTWVAGTLPGASQLTSALGTATFNGHAIASVSSAVGQYIAAGNYQQVWNFASASGTSTISNFDRGGYFGASGITLSGAVSAPGGVPNQVNFTGTLSGSGVTGPLAGSFYANPKTADPIAGVGGSFAVSNGSTYKAAGTFAACRAGTPC